MTGYLGAKGQIYRQVIALFPPHEVYAEPFLGSGAVFFAKAPAPMSYGWDLSSFAASGAATRAAHEWPNAPIGVAITCGDGLAWLEYVAEHGWPSEGRKLVYADPPYPLCTRTSEKRYEHEFTDDDHRRLARVLHKLAAQGVAVIISSYPSDLYDELFGMWRTAEFQAMTRGGVRTEKVWLSYDPNAPFWAAFAGKNKTDRQRIKRKAERWAANFRNLPGAERVAVMAALMAEALDPTIPAQSDPSAGDHPQPPASTLQGQSRK